MLGVDTNVIVRYLTRDDKPQYERARRLIDSEVTKGEPVLVSLLVLLETEWVLRSRYEMAKPEIVAAFSALLETADLTFEDEPSVETAIYSWKDSAAEFADCLIEARNRKLGCRATATFDGKALKLAGFVSVSQRWAGQRPPSTLGVRHRPQSTPYETVANGRFTKTRIEENGARSRRSP